MKKATFLWLAVILACIGIIALKVLGFQQCQVNGFSALYCISQLF